jgi:SNF2 family DNA or RNA helicase
MAEFKTKPYLHQIECLERFGGSPYFALLAEMGTGKTWIIINNVADLFRKELCSDLLVFAPNGVHTNWTRLELPKHMPDDINWKAAAWNSTAKKSEREEMGAMSDFDGLRILTMNWEALQTKRGFAKAEEFLKNSTSAMIVCDESHYIKNPDATRTENLMLLKDYALYRRIMSGTPIANGPFDLFSQFDFLDSGILETTSFYAFKSEYAILLRPGNPLLDHIKEQSKRKRTPQIVAKGPDGRPQYRNLDKLTKLIAPHSFRVLKKDCLDLPPKIYKTLFYELTKEQQKVYDKAYHEYRLELDGEDTPIPRLVMEGKLNQITAGYYLHPDAVEPVRIEGGNPKLDLLVDRVDKIIEGGGKVIVWARYRVQIADLAQRLKHHKFVEYHGGVKMGGARDEAKDSFENGESTVLIGNQQAGGVGITLNAASCVIYFSNNYSILDRLQSEDRAHRIGQEKNVVYLDLVSKGTVDEEVIKTLTFKEEVSEAILSPLSGG